MAIRRTEAQHSHGPGLQARPVAEVLELLQDAQSLALAAVRSAHAALQRAAEVAAAALQAGGKMAYAGAGSSGLMALADCLELAGTFGIPPAQTPMLFAGGVPALLHMTGGVEDDMAAAARDFAAARISKGDVVLCLAASGTTPYTLAVARFGREAGAMVIGFANVAEAPLLQIADIAVLLDTGPEVVAGSTRMGAATAQKVALNMISVLVGLRLGAVHDGYMVNLVADNAKLQVRAAEIVSAVAGCSVDAAAQALIATNGAVKPAILVARGASASAAQAALIATKGQLVPLLQ
jgi:N-acetylmuramic acid 6-phosphate etherase